MSRVEEIERAVEQLPPADFAKLVVWVNQRRDRLSNVETDLITRDHSAFLTSYSTEDEGLYDDVAG